MLIRKLRFAVIATCVSGIMATAPVAADGFAGAYLAARHAFADSDFPAASQYFTRALVQDPSNIELMESALLSYVDQGEIDRGLAIARRLISKNPSHQVANMLLLSEAVKSGELVDAVALFEDDEAIGPLVDGLAMAWIQVAQGNMASALDTFDKVAKEPGLQSFGLYHKALSLALVGDFEGAEEILAGRNGVDVPATRQGVIAQAEILSQLERNDDALALMDEVFGPDLDPELQVMRAQLSAGETLPFTAVRNAEDGLAEVFYSVAGALMGEANDGYTLVYTRVAEYLRPDHVDSILLTAQLLENLDQYELATQAYDRIPREDPAFHAAELGRADALQRAGNNDAAIEVLEQLSETHADMPDVFVTLGDSYRRLERYAEAASAYDRAVELYGTPDQTHWVLYYTRGIANERIKKWDLAEADFRKALELQPDQPQVLNYLGYSFVEMQINLDEALDMIERAVEARPDDGYITDSLGWVLYRLGRYDEAVKFMERATELMAVDPIVNDHLGDVLWAVGRKREAEFQWSRAMSFEPDEKDAIRIRRKLDVGLDLVLEEEGADPISVANDG